MYYENVPKYLGKKFGFYAHKSSVLILHYLHLLHYRCLKIYNELESKQLNTKSNIIAD
jgi:hypothetical protein